MLQLPADDKDLMHLTMGILVIQGMFNSAFSLTLRVRDVKGDQRRVHLSTSVRCAICLVFEIALWAIQCDDVILLRVSK